MGLNDHKLTIAFSAYHENFVACVNINEFQFENFLQI